MSTSAPTTTLDIVIVNWNAGGHLARCLEAVANSTASHYTLTRVLVVDNASTDSSMQCPYFARPEFQALHCKSNIGFAAACNLGASKCNAEFVLFLNPDVYLSPTSVDAAMKFMLREDASQVAACGIQLTGLDGRVQRSCARIPNPINFFWHASGLTKVSPRLFLDITLDEWDHSSARNVPHVIGAFYLMRRIIFLEVGGFDERFFVYLEDLDLSARLGKSGWQIHYLTEAPSCHFGGGSSENVRAIALFYSLRSRLLYARKHFSTIGALFVFAATLLVEPLGRVFYALLIRRPQAIVECLIAYRHLSRSVLSCWWHSNERTKVSYAVLK